MFVDVFGGLRTCAKSKSVPRMGSYLIISSLLKS